MSIFEVTNLYTGSVELIEAKNYSDLRNYCRRVKISALNSNYIQIIHYQVGVIHNENGPAVVYINGHKEWYSNGQRHNENGPAVVFTDGSKQWWINSKYITNTKAVFNEYIRSHKS